LIGWCLTSILAVCQLYLCNKSLSQLLLIDCYLTPSKELFRYIMAGKCCILMTWRSLLCVRSACCARLFHWGASSSK